MKKSNLLHHWKTLKKISLNLCSKMLILLISRPHLIPFIAIATLETMRISDQKLENHTRHNKANGHKHALWNALISFHIQKFFLTPEAAVQWTKKITDMHEECFKNQPDAKQMDLDNNEIGRNVYVKTYHEFNKRPKKKILLNRITDQQDNFIFLED